MPFNTVEFGLVFLGTADVFTNCVAAGVESPVQEAAGILSGVALAGLGVVLNTRRERREQQSENASNF